MGSGGLAPLFLTLTFDEVGYQLEVQGALPFRKSAPLAVALEDVFFSDNVWNLQGRGHFAPACPARSLAGPDLGAGQPGSCPEHQPITSAKTPQE
jgi:hypothetical protein